MKPFLQWCLDFILYLFFLVGVESLRCHLQSQLSSNKSVSLYISRYNFNRSDELPLRDLIIGEVSLIFTIKESFF